MREKSKRLGAERGMELVPENPEYGERALQRMPGGSQLNRRRRTVWG